MQDHSLPLTEFHHPATFAGRGVAVPFTTPLLAPARVRESRRSSIELVVPNPSGGRGVYIVQWGGTRSLCTPTVHDTLLFQHISRAPRIDPFSVRCAALEVARQGYAGRAAAAAAQAALDRDKAQCLLAQFLLLVALAEQVEATGHRSTSLADRTEDFDRRASQLLHRIAPSLGRPAAQLAAGLSEIGDAFAGVGAAMHDVDARIPRLLMRMSDTEASVTKWRKADVQNDIGALGQSIARSLRVAHEYGHRLMARTRDILHDPIALLRQWISAPADVMRLASRCDWLLDGWERVCTLWQNADEEGSQRAALMEIAQLLPVLPREAADWFEVSILPEAMDESCRIVSQDDAWRRGSAGFVLIQRNESLRAKSI